MDVKRCPAKFIITDYNKYESNISRVIYFIFLINISCVCNVRGHGSIVSLQFDGPNLICKIVKLHTSKHVKIQSNLVVSNSGCNDFPDMTRTL